MAINIKPDWSKSHFREAEAYLKMKNYCEAAGSFWEACKIEPENKTFK